MSKGEGGKDLKQLPAKWGVAEPYARSRVPQVAYEFGPLSVILKITLMCVIILAIQAMKIFYMGHMSPFHILAKWVLGPGRPK